MLVWMSRWPILQSRLDGLWVNTTSYIKNNALSNSNYKIVIWLKLQATGHLTFLLVREVLHHLLPQLPQGRLTIGTWEETSHFPLKNQSFHFSQSSNKKQLHVPVALVMNRRYSTSIPEYIKVTINSNIKTNILFVRSFSLSNLY